MVLRATNSESFTQHQSSESDLELISCEKQSSKLLKRQHCNKAEGYARESESESVCQIKKQKRYNVISDNDEDDKAAIDLTEIETNGRERSTQDDSHFSGEF